LSSILDAAAETTLCPLVYSGKAVFVIKAPILSTKLVNECFGAHYFTAVFSSQQLIKESANTMQTGVGLQRMNGICIRFFAGTPVIFIHAAGDIFFVANITCPRTFI